MNSYLRNEDSFVSKYIFEKYIRHKLKNAAFVKKLIKIWIMTTMVNKCFESDEELSKAEIRKSIFSFSGPIIAELMLMSMMAMVNLAMVGHLGAFALSAVGLTNQPVFISLAVFQSFNIGATALISRFIGAKDYQEAKAVVVQTMIMSVILGAVPAIIGIIFSKQIVLFLGAQQDTVEYASMYMKYMAAGMFLQSIPTAVTSILRGAGESKIPMRYNIISNIINVAISFPLIYGVAFLPGLGLKGDAIATTIAKLIACIMSVYALLNTRLPIALSLRDKFRLDFVIIKRIMNIGVSAAGEQLAMRIGFLLYTKIVAELGTSSFAAHQICLNVTQFVSNVINGLAVAASSFTGRNLGAKNPKLAEEYCRQITNIGLIISLSIGASFFFAGYQISQIYTSDVSVLVQAAFVLKIATLITFPQNYLSIVSGCLRGAGDTVWPLVSSLIGMIVARVSLAALFVLIFHWGLGGAWFAAVLDQSIRSVLIYFRFKTGKWKEIVV
jgi:putative MATE family efflux protein